MKAVTPAGCARPGTDAGNADTLTYVALGANLGDAPATLDRAVVQLGQLARTRVLRVSGYYRSAPWQAQGPDFTNAVAALCTGLTPDELLAGLQRIETGLGRLRPYRHAPRTLDLDILLYGELRVDLPHLQIPHPRLAERAFVLLPLSEIAPHCVTVAQLAAVSAQRIERLRPVASVAVPLAA